MRKTQGVYDLVAEVLRGMREPYGEHIIEDVCLAIEHTPAYRKRYDELSAELRTWVVNNWIGQYVKEITGRESILQVAAKRSKLITSYTRLKS